MSLANLQQPFAIQRQSPFKRHFILLPGRVGRFVMSHIRTGHNQHIFAIFPDSSGNGMADVTQSGIVAMAEADR